MGIDNFPDAENKKDRVQAQGNNKDSSSITPMESGSLFSEIVRSSLFATTTTITDVASNASVETVPTFKPQIL